MSDPEPDKFQVVETTATDRVGTVRLYDETWEHIVYQHPEFAGRFPSLEHAVIDTLINPTVVCASTTQPETTVVFASSNNVKGSGHILSVPVRILGDTTGGRVVTAMFGSAPKGEVIYTEGDGHD